MIRNLLRFGVDDHHLVTKNVIRHLSSRDTFGDLSRTGSKSLKVDITNRFYPEDPDKYDKEEYDLVARKNAYYYKYEISKYARKGSRGLNQALRLFEEMKSVARLTPTYENFAPLIFGCGKAGFTKKAFDLYQEMQKYDTRRPPASLVDCLIWSCGVCPFPEYGLERLNWFSQHLRVSHNYSLDQRHYHSAITAYGRLGNLNESVRLLQEMINNRLLPTTQTFNALLTGCASNKKSGTALGLRIYKRMKLYGIRPNTLTYHLFARCIRDCGMGSEKMIHDTLQEMPAMTTINTRLRYNMMTGGGKSNRERNYIWSPMLEDLCISLKKALDTESDESTAIANSSQTSLPTVDLSKTLVGSRDKMVKMFTDENFAVEHYCDKNILPNLLSDDHLETLTKIQSIDYEALDTRTGRLMLFGGMHGFLEMMKKDGCEPDVGVFGFLLCCIDKKRSLQIEYFRLSEEYKIKRTHGFYNLLLAVVVEDHLATTRIDFVKELMDRMLLDGLKPDKDTYEIMASACNNTRDCLQYLKDIDDANLIVTEQMIHRLMWVALRRSDFDFMTTVLEQYKKRGVRPTKKIVEHIENKRLATSDLILKQERGILNPDRIPIWFNETNIENFRIFQNVLSDWLKQVEVDPEVEDHPWEQFQVASMSNRGPRENDIISTLKPILKARRERELPLRENVEQ